MDTLGSCSCDGGIRNTSVSKAPHNAAQSFSVNLPQGCKASVAGHTGEGPYNGCEEFGPISDKDMAVSCICDDPTDIGTI